MKLLPATSFFLFILVFFLNSCESDKVVQQKKTSVFSTLKNKIKEKIQCDEYDSAIFYSQKLLDTSLVQGKTEFVIDAYNSISKSYGFLGEYDSAIFYTHQMLKVALKNEKSEHIKKTYNKLSIYFNIIEKYDSAIFFGDKLYEISLQTFDTINMAKASYKKGIYHRNKYSFPSAYKNFIASKNLYLQLGDTIEAGRKLLEIANLQKKQGNYGASQLSALEGLEYLESTDDLKTLGGLYLVLSVASKETGKLKVAEKRIDEALALIKDSSFIKKIGKKNISIFKNTKANIFKEQKKYDAAITIYEDLLKDGKGDTFETKRVNANLAYTLFLKNGFNKKSDSLLQNSLSYFSSRDKKSELFSAQLKLAQLYSKINKKKSLKYVNEALETAKNTGVKESIYEALEVKINQNYQPEDYTRYVKIGKQIAANKENLNYVYANEKFDFDKSEKARIDSEKARVASEKEKIIAENKAIVFENSVAKFQNLVLFLALVLIVVLVLIFFIYQKIKRRHKIEKVKTVHFTEARISSKVHDELANDLYKLISQLETTDPEKDVILDKLDIIYNQARDVSKQIQTVETGEGFAEELNILFRSYQSEEVNVLLKRYNIDIWNGISSHIKITVYRVLQELLTNMKKHSNAGLVVVSIEKNNKKLFIQYIDNGKGFAEEISKNGLHNAENRIHAIEGTLTFDTELDTGCKFSINVPV